jgi:eight-cysteine-cluster-containing protein
MKYALIALLFACGSKAKPADNSPGEPATPAMDDCIKTGCSGTVCTEPGKEVVTTCEFKPEYACYRDATCARQTDGTCNWTMTAGLNKCLSNPPKVEGGGAPQ